ncbi:MAG TPA: SDR family NAD(P)-dependent oxidoreductase [Candidatus Binatia bacterium]|nr:SDR family NAD(P)-dependent oxidoreductase [Candidatus Binatia bacterium]
MSAAPRAYTPPPDLLRGRTVLITGATGGLGRATALAAASRGAQLVLLGRSVPKLEALDDELRACGARGAALYPMDLAGAGWDDYAALAETLQGEFGALHGLAHCAAHFKHHAPLSAHDPRDWLETLQVNLNAAFALTAQCLPLLRDAGDASVVFCTDSRRERAFAGAYGVAKAALEGMLQVWAQELDGVRLNALDPGPMATGLRRRGFVADVDGSAADPAGAAGTLLWLLGRDSAAVRGEIVRR